MYKKPETDFFSCQGPRTVPSRPSTNLNFFIGIKNTNTPIDSEKSVSFAERNTLLPLTKNFVLVLCEKRTMKYSWEYFCP